MIHLHLKLKVGDLHLQAFNFIVALLDRVLVLLDLLLSLVELRSDLGKFGTVKLLKAELVVFLELEAVLVVILLTLVVLC